MECLVCSRGVLKVVIQHGILGDPNFWAHSNRVRQIQGLTRCCSTSPKRCKRQFRTLISLQLKATIWTPQFTESPVPMLHTGWRGVVSCFRFCGLGFTSCFKLIWLIFFNVSTRNLFLNAIFHTRTPRSGAFLDGHNAKKSVSRLPSAIMGSAHYCPQASLTWVG